MSPRVPNFLFIGPDKAGSTWLYEALGGHRQVFLSQVKELFFFDRFYDKGWRWYLRFFKRAQKQHRVIGEICHDYLFSRLACQRIARDIPSVKLMVCLREPSQRAFSEYLYMIKLGLLTCDFETALKEVDELIDHGRYAKHLSYYLKHFKRDQIYVATFDDLVANAQNFFDDLCDFLGLERVALPRNLRGKVLPAARPKLRHVAKFARGMSWKVRRWGFPGVVEKIKESTLVRRALYRPYGPNETPEMSSWAREYLRRVFSSELQQLDALLGTHFRVQWGYPEPGTQRALPRTECGESAARPSQSAVL